MLPAGRRRSDLRRPGDEGYVSDAQGQWGVWRVPHELEVRSFFLCL